MMFRQHIAVTTLLANLCVAVITEWALPELRWLAGITAWLAVVLLWATVKHHQKWLCAGLLSAGLAATFVGAVGNATVDWRSLLAGHSLLLAMLTGLAFVRPPCSLEASPASKGAAEFLKTMVGLTALGGLINVASMIIVGDRLRQLRALNESDFKLLSRAYSIVAAYSPFIGGMALCLHLVPGSQLREIWHINLPVLVVALAYTFLAARLGDDERLRSFRGFSFSRQTMTVPIMMGLAVIGFSISVPTVSVLAIVAAVAPLISVIQCACGLAGPIHNQVRSIREKSAGLGPEAAVFMSAGVLAQGLALASEAYGVDWSAFESLSASAAALTLFACVAPSFLGIHPVVPITIAAGLLAPLGAPPSVLAAIFAMSWAIGCTVNPFSGITLTFQGRYGATGSQFLRWNAPYSVFLTVAGGAWIFFYPQF